MPKIDLKTWIILFGLTIFFMIGWTQVRPIMAQAASGASSTNPDQLQSANSTSEALAASSSQSTGTITALKVAHSNKCLEILNGSQNSGAAAVQGSCDGKADQQFELVSMGPDIFQLKAGHSGQCLEVAGTSTNSGAHLQQNTCTTEDHQQFRIMGSPSTIVAVHSGLCIDVPGVSSVDGITILQWPCHGGQNQQWSGTIDVQ